MGKVIIRGCDTEFKPTAAQVSAAKKDGVRWWGGYFGGVDAAHIWSDEDFASTGENFRIAPIWVPQQAPALFKPADTIAAMLAEAERRDIPKGCVLVLDAEEALTQMLNQSKSTQEELAHGIDQGGYLLLIYAGGNLIVPQWRASWYGTQWPTSLPAGDGTYRAWQWESGSASVFVPGADLDVMTQAIFDKLWDGKPATQVVPVAQAPVVTEPANEQESAETAVEQAQERQEGVDTAPPVVAPEPTPAEPVATQTATDATVDKALQQTILDAVTNVASALNTVIEATRAINAALVTLHNAATNTDA